MNHFLLFSFVICQLLQLHTITAFGFAPTSKILVSKISQSPRTQVSVSSSQSGAELDGEMDKFFELAAESGIEKIRLLTPEERVERVIRGEYLEDLIFEVRSELMSLEEAFMAGKEGADAGAVKDMRAKFNGLKNEYKDVVGANDLPLYFGRTSDGMQ
mmetsp:Transcript_30992/g.29605  ORF Transcript_30992/g.29605 Transcript_30992/m.29605 type:complete len:158 (+) Transcript_30992:36-509(+)